MSKTNIESESIILNRICTGDYLDEGSNLGHEVVNLFKADNGEYYVYLMSEGTYPISRKNEKIKAVYLTKGSNKHCVEVVGIAKGLESVLNPEEGFKCLNLKELDNVAKELSEEVELSKLKKRLKSLEKEELFDWLHTESFLKMKPFNDDQKDELKNIAEQLYDFAKKYIKDNNNLCTAICRRAAHIKQLWYIIDNNVRYGGVRVNELFKQNSTEQYGMSIYLTFKAEKIVKPKNPMYLVTKENYKVETQDDEKKVENIVVNREVLAGTKLLYYIENNKENESYKNLKDYIDKKEYWDENISEYKKINTEESDFTFLTLIRKEYDELVFSNMFQYFFTHKSYRHLFIKLLKDKSKVTLSDSYTVKREEANIDLLIIDKEKNCVVVIENKVRSGLNGLVYDENNNILETQLGKYKSYVENEYPNMKRYFFVFKPNYSIITDKELEGYTAIKYSEIAEKLEEGLNIRTDKATEVYFADFVKALKIHSSKDDKRYEETMRRRLQSVIDSQQESSDNGNI